MGRCSHTSCTRTPSFIVGGAKKPVYCKQHAEDGMVNVRTRPRRRCSHDVCTTIPTFNTGGSVTALFCKRHAEDGMVDVLSRLCSHESCTKRPCFNSKGTMKPLYCKHHAKDGMVNVHSRRCSYASCTTTPAFNFDGSTTAEYCFKHAYAGMVNVRSRRCIHRSCIRQPSWGVLTNSGTPIVCRLHKSDILSSAVFNLFSRCETAGCKKVSRWGLAGKQPSHCPDHGPLEEGLVCTVPAGTARVKRRSPSLPNSARGPRPRSKLSARFESLRSRPEHVLVRVRSTLGE